ncbi:T9SS type A sorting domain-containing protein [Vicingaceae bacterium]|nr:T9SS type A sorting domain-containing protein [Vicingaceae bacterium]
MIKKILFISSLFFAGVLSAQTFQLSDYNDVDISNTTHYEYGTPTELGLTKFHVKNLTGTQASFALKVEKVHVPYTTSGLACCFGTACFSASATVSGTQVINNGVGDNVSANGIYTDLKLSPVTWMWADCANDSATWIVTVYDPANPSDEVTATIVWKCGNAPVSVNEISKENLRLSAFPNPATNNLTVSYKINKSFNNASVELFDVLGQKLISNELSSNAGDVMLDVSNLNAGIYFYTVRVDGNAIRTERVIVK